MQDPAVIAFQDRGTTECDDSLRVDATEVTITLKDGRRHTCRIDHCIGSASNQMTDEQLARKFADLAETGDRCEAECGADGASVGNGITG